MGLRGYSRKLDADRQLKEQESRRKKQKADEVRYRKNRQSLCALRDGLIIEAKTSAFPMPLYNIARELSNAIFEIDVYLDLFLGE